MQICFYYGKLEDDYLCKGMTAMQISEPRQLDKLRKTFQLNKQQLNFGSYAAELSFYIIWAIVPVMLALANVIAILPISVSEIIKTIKVAVPDEVSVLLVPLLEGYISNTSGGIFSLGLVISLWPASNVFNTLQRVLNTIYKAKPRKNFVLSRGFAYVFTLAIVILTVALTFISVFGEQILNFVREFFNLNLYGLDLFLQQGWIVSLIGLFILILCVYHFVPNKDWDIKYSLPGTVFTLIGFYLVSQLFTIYLAIAGGNTSNGTIGVFIIFIIWLYFNSMVIAVGAYINVLFHDYKEKSYWQMVEETTTYDTHLAHSSNYRKHSQIMPGLHHWISIDNKKKQMNKEKSEM